MGSWVWKVISTCIVFIFKIEKKGKTQKVDTFYLFQVQKGKQGTKGQKQIMQENTDTLNFYRNMILGAASMYFVLGMIFFDSFPALDLVGWIMEK